MNMRESATENAGSIPDRWPRFGKEKVGSNPPLAREADGSAGLTAWKDSKASSAAAMRQLSGPQSESPLTISLKGAALLPRPGSSAS